MIVPPLNPNIKFEGGFSLKDFPIRPSILEEFNRQGVDTVTYNFGLFMVPFSNLYEYQKHEFDPKFLKNRRYVAKSGVSSVYSISSVEIESYIGAGFKNRSTTATSFVVQMKESFGLTLFDKLVETSIELDLPRITEIPMFLSFGFNGFTEDGQVFNIEEMYVWGVNVVDIKPEVDITGTMYTIQMYLTSETAHFKESFCLHERIGLNNIETVNDFIKELEDAMNNQAFKFKGYLKEVGTLPEEFENGPNGDFYSIEIAPELDKPGALKNFGEMKFRTGNPTKKDGRTEPQIVLDKGWSIPRIFEAIYANLEGLPEGTSDEEKSKDEKEKLKTQIRVSTEVYYGKFLPHTQEFGRHIKFIIQPFVISRIQTGETGTEENIKENSKVSLEMIKKYALMSKKYDYIFSGKNTSVLNAEVDFNNLWAVALSYSPSVLVYGTDDRYSETKPNEDEFDIEAIKRMSLPEKWAARNKIKDQETDASNATQARFQESVLDQEIEKQSRSIEQETKTPEGAFIDNRLLLESPSKFTLEELYNNSRIKPKIEFKVDPDLTRYSITSTNPTIDMHKRISVLEQAFDKKGFLIQLRLEIKGDPYWLGATTIEKVKRRRYIKSQGKYPIKTDDEYPDYNIGEHCFYFEYFTPFTINDETGLAEIRKSTVVRGIYSVIAVTHKFENGRFTQSLQAYRNEAIGMKP